MTMNTLLTGAIVSASLLIAVFCGMRVRMLLPEHHLNAETKDTVKLAMGLVATMSALLLGMLVSSAKGSFDTTRSEVIQMSAKVAFLDRILVAYGPEAAEARAQFRAAAEQGVKSMWPEEASKSAQLSPNAHTGDSVFGTIQNLTPSDDRQRSLKNQAVSLAMDLAQLRTLMVAQSVSSISKPLLIVMVFWLFVIFFSFSLHAPRNASAALALTVSAISVSVAVYLILELDQPFGGLFHISSEPMVNALKQLAS
jgi:hypothetical protein